MDCQWNVSKEHVCELQHSVPSAMTLCPPDASAAVENGPATRTLAFRNTNFNAYRVGFSACGRASASAVLPHLSTGAAGYTSKFENRRELISTVSLYFRLSYVFAALYEISQLCI